MTQDQEEKGMCDNTQKNPAAEEAGKDYTTYPEGFEQLAKDIDAPTDDLEVRKRMLVGLLASLKD